jgi:hypothetical protein
VIFLPEVFAAGAVEVDGWGDGRHGGKAKERLAPRETNIYAKGA